MYHSHSQSRREIGDNEEVISPNTTQIMNLVEINSVYTYYENRQFPAFAYDMNESLNEIVVIHCL